MYWPAPTLLTGADSALKLPEEMKRRGVSRALFVTDSNLLSIGLPNALLDALKPRASAAYGVRCGDANALRYDRAGREALRAGGLRRTVALGGGSVIDTAKVAAARVAAGNAADGFLKIRGRSCRPYSWCSGHPAPVTIAAVVTDERHHKYAINDPGCCRFAPCSTPNSPPRCRLPSRRIPAWTR